MDSTEWRGLKMYPFAVPADGQRFATVSKREVRLYDIYDAATGERLTPPLRNDVVPKYDQPVNTFAISVIVV